MTRPFIPFPIFPSYDHWQPNQVKRFPVNAYVSARLNEVDESCLPFINAWYADRYLNWIAHSWSPQTPHLQYYKTINGLEKMLNWSFANNLSLLDWTDADFRDYVGFVQTPDSDWASPSIQPRFLVSPGKDYHDYPINPEWKLFHTARASKSSDAIDRNVWKREIRSVTQFMDFYLKDVSAMRPNVSAAKLDWLSFKEPQARGSISDVVMEWIFETLPNLLSPHNSHLIEMYLTIARHTVRPMWQVLGTASSPGRIDQFMRNERGNWLESHPKNGSAVHHGHLAYGVLAVASDSSPTIIKNLAADLERLGQGRIDRLTKVGAEFHDILISDGVSAERVCRHLRIRVIDTLLSNNRDINAAKEILASICEQESDAAAAFDILSHRALGLIENRGRWTLQGILRLLKTRGIKLRNDGSPAALLEPTGDLSAAFHVLRSSNMEPCSEMLEKALSCLCSECKSTSASAAELLSCWLNEGVVIDADKVDKAIEHWGGFQTAKPLLRLHTPLHSIIELSDKIRATTMAAEK